MIAMAQVHSAAPNPKHLDMLTIDLGAERKVKLQAASEEDRDAWVVAIEQSKVEAWSRQEGQEATREQAPTADATLQIASPQRVRLEEEGAPSKVEIKADLLDDSGKRSTVLQRQCCVIA